MKKERSALSAAGTGIFTILGIVYIPVSYTHLGILMSLEYLVREGLVTEL